MPSREPGLGNTPYAKYVSRVGALAVALGIGSAVAVGPGIAWADDSPKDGGYDAVSSAGSGPSKPRDNESPRDTTQPRSRNSDEPADHSAADRGQPRVTKTPEKPGESDPAQVVTDDELVQIQQNNDDALELDSGDKGSQPGEGPEVAVGEDGRTATGLSESGVARQGYARTPGGSARALTNVPTDAASIVDEPNPAARELSPTDAPRIADAQISGVELTLPHTEPAVLKQPNQTSTAAVDVASGALVPVAGVGSDVITTVSTALRNLLTSGTGHLPDSPLLWALMAWTRREAAVQLPSQDVVPYAVQSGQVIVPSDSERALAETPSTSVFFGTSPRVVEEDGTVQVPIVRTGDLTRASTIQYGITHDTATAGVDYVGGNGTLTIAAGEDRGYIPIRILDDNVAEPTETFVVSIINVDSNSTILYPRTTRIDIMDDENPIVDPPSPPLKSDYNVTEQVVVSDLNKPIAFEFAPRDPSLMYIAEKGGVIKVFDTDTGKQSTFVDISTEVNDIQDRGLMDIALHPDFGKPVAPGEPEHNFVYAFYVVDPAGTESKPAGKNEGMDGAGNRFAYLVRFTADEATGFTTAVPGSQVILLGGKAVPGESELQPRTLEDISGAGAVDSTSDFSQPESGFDAQTGEYVDNYVKVDSRSHAGGSLAFGPDGALYVSIGDGTSFNTTDPRSASVQDVDSLSGKILRIDPITGQGLPDNPFVKPGDNLSANSSKVYQLGLRNPFSMTFSEDGRLFITNTGWNTWEEIESGHAGANFGWPYFEGGGTEIARTPGYQYLDGADEFYAAVKNGTITITQPYRAFAHSEGAPGFQVGAIVGVDGVYTGTRYPAEFKNDIFFTDVNDGEVYVVDINNRNEVKYLYSSNGAPVAFSQGSDGYVYVANLSDGTITRLLIESKNAPIADPNSARELQLEALRRDTGWIPLWGSVVSAVSFVLDLNDFLIAQRAGNAADIADEADDLVADGLGIFFGLLPGGTLVADAVADQVAPLLSQLRVSAT